MERRLLQKDIANAVGVSISAISKFEKDIDNPSRETLSKFADYFGVTVDFLLGNKQNISNLEESFPEGVQVLMRADKELSEETKRKMIRLMKAFLEEEK